MARAGVSIFADGAGPVAAGRGGAAGSGGGLRRASARFGAPRARRQLTGKLYRARSRLYRSQILEVNMR